MGALFIARDRADDHRTALIVIDALLQRLKMPASHELRRHWRIPVVAPAER